MTKKHMAQQSGRAAALPKSNQTTTAMTAQINPNTCLIEHANGGITMNARRTRVCVEAVWEIESLARMASKVAETDSAAFAVRGISARLIQLSHALSDGLTNVVEPTISIECDVYVKLRGEIEGGNHV